MPAQSLDPSRKQSSLNEELANIIVDDQQQQQHHPPANDRLLYVDGHLRSTEGPNSYNNNNANYDGPQYSCRQSPHSVFGLVNFNKVPDNVNAIFKNTSRNGEESKKFQNNNYYNGIVLNGFKSDSTTTVLNGAPSPEVKTTAVATIQPIISNVFPNGHSVNSATRHNSSSASKISPVRAGCYWFAQGGDSPSVNNYRYNVNMTEIDHGTNVETDVVGEPGSSTDAHQLDRDERLRVLRERQAEERQRRLEELRNASVSAQKFREMQEEERRRKIDEIRWRDTERRHLVEERKRQIWEAEKERRETLLRKSQDREARIEAKRNSQRNSIGFAFGSCTPRMLDLEMNVAVPTAASSSAMAGRRSNSQSNVLAALTMSRGESVETQDGESNFDHRRSSVKHRHTIHEALSWETYATLDSQSHQSQPETSTNHPKMQTVSVNAPWAVITDIPENSLTSTSTISKPNPTFLNGRRFPQSALCGAAAIVSGDDLMTQSMTSLASSAPFRRGRRRTDLVPTIPSPNMSMSMHHHRDSSMATPTSRTRSPGRAYSMTRLDQLATPKKMRPLEALREEFKQLDRNGRVAAASKEDGKKKMTPAKSMGHLAYRSRQTSGRPRNTTSGTDQSGSLSKSKSTSHLGPRNRSTRSTTRGSPTPPPMSQSMWHLASKAPGPLPRPTRTSILRRDSGVNIVQRNLLPVPSVYRGRRQFPVKSTGGSGSGDSETDASSIRAPSSPSRPQSSMSQQSLSSQTSSVSLRARSAQSAPRRTRPLSVAGTQPDRLPSADMERRGRSVEKRMPSSVSSPVNSKPPPRAKSVGAGQLINDGQSPVLKVAPVPAPRRPPPPLTVAKKATPTADKPKIAPKPNLRKQASPDVKPSTVKSQTDAAAAPIMQAKLIESKEQAPPIPQESSTNGSESPSHVEDFVSAVSSDITSVLKVQDESEVLPLLTDVSMEAEVPDGDVCEEKTANNIEQKSAANIVPSEIEVPKDALQQTLFEDDSVGTPVVKPRITTEEEAKAALAEKRRLAREQAEREAELERQRQEQLRLEEEERLRREEEEQREWELEQERSRLAEQERLMKAIEEQQQREEEEKMRREEEAKQKEEKERSERLVREEQEKARKENEEKLRKEEEERAERRRRVEAIMSRTRGGKAGGTNTPPPSSKSNMEQEQLMDDVQQQLIAHQNGISSSQETSPTDIRTNGFSLTAQNDGHGNLDMIKSTSLPAPNDDVSHRNFESTMMIVADHDHDQFREPDEVQTKPSHLLQDHQLIDLTVVGDGGGTIVENPTMVVMSKDNVYNHHHHHHHQLHHLSNEDSVNFNNTRNGIDDSTFAVDNYANNARQETTVTDLMS